MSASIADLLGSDAQSLLTHKCQTIGRDQLHLPGPDFVDRVFGPSDRSPRVLGSLHPPRVCIRPRCLYGSSAVPARPPWARPALLRIGVGEDSPEVGPHSRVAQEQGAASPHRAHDRLGFTRGAVRVLPTPAESG